jgi:hypothetical protein
LLYGGDGRDEVGLFLVSALDMQDKKRYKDKVEVGRIVTKKDNP